MSNLKSSLLIVCFFCSACFAPSTSELAPREDGAPIVLVESTAPPESIGVEPPLGPSSENRTVANQQNRLDRINSERAGPLLREKEISVLAAVLLYLPNRVFDLVDVFRIDVGLGSAVGAVARVTRYGQIGARYVDPMSVRVGVSGRHVPFSIERHSESGVGKNFRQSKDRFVTPMEVGIGLDAIVGAYAGLSFDELWDFFLGIVFLDPKADDF